MKICSTEGCNRPMRAKGFCTKHYMKFKYEAMAVEGEKSCSVENCKKVNFAKELCRLHYSRLRRNDSLTLRRDILKKCSVHGCETLITISAKSGLCRFHLMRKKSNTPLDLPKQKFGGGIGERNINWKGGVAAYPKHSEMKRIRKQKIKDSEGKCTVCNKQFEPPYRSLRIHHIDGSKDNHAYDNLLVACSKCSIKFHKNQKKTSKYKRLYGINLSDLATFYNISGWKIWRLARTHQLESIIEEHRMAMKAHLSHL